jgi:hypothetical protein
MVKNMAAKKTKAHFIPSSNLTSIHPTEAFSPRSFPKAIGAATRKYRFL